MLMMLALSVQTASFPGAAVLMMLALGVQTANYSGAADAYDARPAYQDCELLRGS